MSRFLGVMCAVFVVGGLFQLAPVSSEDRSDDPFGSSHVVKQQAKLAVRSENRTKQSAEQWINSTLDSPLKEPLQFQELPLNEILRIIEEEYEIPIVVDMSGFDELAVDPEIEVSVDVRGISLRSALNLMFRQPGLEDLTYIYQDEVLLVTTIERTNSELTTVIYRVDDLETYPAIPPSATVRVYYSPLIDVITSCVESSAWSENGTGNGHIRMLEPGILIVSQSREVHTKIAKFLNEVRGIRKEIAGSDLSSDGSLETRGFWIDSRIQGTLAKSEEAREVVVNSIRESVDWEPREGIDEDEVWLRVLPEIVMVRHHPRVVSQVSEVLGSLGFGREIPGGTMGGFKKGGGGGSF